MLNAAQKKIFSGLALGVLLGCYSTPVSAADNNLIFVGKDSENHRYYLNRNWLKAEENGFVDFVYTMRLPEPDSNGILFIDAHVKGHCATSRLGITSVQLYNVNDKLVSEKKLDTLVFDIVQPGSMNQLLLDATCRILNTAN
ncbi:hypothetical protein K9N68_33755 [Kovacikia minuta CCNUW1]|uniref:hypothetical protein n=1 Tax=Kovacikia minuta TaxID=2931930 RepID=UPI001CCBB226|nr:hypothetical protein [Kovacikia minuta]UBF26409.1 hypothetical protein K9N68_33755 [Kovacikia minuta CCNUW1]